MGRRGREAGGVCRAQGHRRVGEVGGDGSLYRALEMQGREAQGSWDSWKTNGTAEERFVFCFFFFVNNTITASTVFNNAEQSILEIKTIV